VGATSDARFRAKNHSHLDLMIAIDEGVKFT